MTRSLTPAKQHSNALRILEGLKKLYPDPQSELNFKNEYELLVAVLLSAQCTDKKVNDVTPALFAAYPDFQTLKKAKLPQIEEIIRPINYYKTKAKHLIETAKQAVANFSGMVPKDFNQLTSLPGVGRKTANVVLGELGISATIPVDTHVFRVSLRLGLASGKTPRAIEDALMETFPPTEWRTLHHCLILHGRRICKAQRPLCEQCEIAQLCPSAAAFLRSSPKRKN